MRTVHAALAAGALLLLAACGGGSGAASAGSSGALHGSITVFAAASLTDVFTQVKKDFEAANPKANVTLNFAGSPTLRTQLSQGAPADIFASADTANMDGAISDGSIQGEPTVFAHNKLVVVLPTGDAKVARLLDLAKPGTKVVIEQQAVPAGAYARQALEKLSKDPAFGSDFRATVLANVVSQEPDVRSVLARIQLGEADAGMLYVSDVSAPAVKDKVKTIAIPDQFNILADYPLAIVENAPNPGGARAFVNYVLGPNGQAALQRYGLLPAKP
jgi:molybdate transport system substrate-binding protein